MLDHEQGGNHLFAVEYVVAYLQTQPKHMVWCNLHSTTLSHSAPLPHSCGAQEFTAPSHLQHHPEPLGWKGKMGPYTDNPEPNTCRTTTRPQHRESILIKTQWGNKRGRELGETKRYEPHYESRFTAVKGQLVSIPDKLIETVQTPYNGKTVCWKAAMHASVINKLIKEKNYTLPAEYHPPSLQCCRFLDLPTSYVESIWAWVIGPQIILLFLDWYNHLYLIQGVPED